ncbi:hypothetical protein VMCG_05792 [Cytospora schulzeri]|uniref:Heterokaryon incompatibility domain-containing protein n=1 Tax=Cytospora schulzeri TaxID=448051 RepID=A0A423WI89_9PEZI|nr:hypothetical protein VMCG_05792 [Valsa malicola]
MRLLNVKNATFKEFIGNDIPPYAILSHTWEDEEVTFKDMKTPSRCHGKLGFNKIRMTCKQAAKDGLEYAWIDTCCIDKSSSAELSEAINSMFRWYKRSSRCYGSTKQYWKTKYPFEK